MTDVMQVVVNMSVAMGPRERIGGVDADAAIEYGIV